MKKIISLILALVMVMGLAATAFAATPTGTITITPPDGVADDAVNTYKIYKVFDAAGNGENISYKLVEGKDTAPAGFKVDDAGNVTYIGTGGNQLTAADITAIAGYVTADDLVATVTANGNNDAVASNLPNGYYYITTSLGSVVTINSTNPDAEVNDKNTVPTLEKKITEVDDGSVDEDGKNALAQIGTKVTYTATITVGNGSKGLVFHDAIGTGLTYNNDVQVTGTNQYTVKGTPDTGDTITITFTDGITAGTEITITYSATMTADAAEEAVANTAYVSYGADGSNNKTTDSTAYVYNAKFTVIKKDGDGNPLGGAGFVIKNEAGNYYKYDENEAAVTWVDAIGNATEFTSNNDGEVQSFVGLADGKYTLVEKTVPAGYNKAADKEFTVAAGTYTVANLQQTADVVNNAGSVLPSTGGIGTTIFYIVGGLLMAGAVVLLVTKKRMA